MSSRWRRVLSRRSALGAAGVAVAEMIAPRQTYARQATPQPGTGVHIYTMFVQTAHSGTFVPKASEPGVFEITLEGTTAQTVYFSDRPERIVGTVPTSLFLENLGFSPENPPNAAIVAETEAGEDILVVELLNPRWDEAALTLTYDVVLLNDYQGDGLGHLAERQADSELANTFGHASLFIDDCPDIVSCLGEYLVIPNIPQSADYRRVGPMPGGSVGRCWSWRELSCLPCDGRSLEDINAICNDTYPECEGTCVPNG